jgi:hypothetical protein
MSKYKVINTTIKPPKPGKNGQDLRNWTEKLGHGVQFRNPQGEIVRVDTNRPRITDYLNEGMLRLQRGGFIRIEGIGDVTEVLKKHTLGKGDNLSSLLDPEEGVANSNAHNSASDRPRAVAVEMGKDNTVARGEGHMVNPDGEPNFVVRANKNLKRKQRFETEVPAPQQPEVTPSEGAAVQGA